MCLVCFHCPIEERSPFDEKCRAFSMLQSCCETSKNASKTPFAQAGRRLKNAWSDSFLHSLTVDDNETRRSSGVCWKKRQTRNAPTTTAEHGSPQIMVAMLRSWLRPLMLPQPRSGCIEVCVPVPSAAKPAEHWASSKDPYRISEMSRASGHPSDPQRPADVGGLP